MKLKVVGIFLSRLNLQRSMVLLVDWIVSKHWMRAISGFDGYTLGDLNFYLDHIALGQFVVCRGPPRHIILEITFGDFFIKTYKRS